MSFTTQVIGIDEITTNPSIRFISTTTDGNSIFVGSETTSGTPDVWQYLNDSWKRISSNLSEETDIKSINALTFFQKKIYAGTSNGLYDFAGLDGGKVWRTSPGGWEDTSLAFPSNYNVSIRELVILKDEIYAAGSVFYVYKYKNDTWSEVLNLGVSAANVADMVTDGVSKIYITANGLETTCYSGVLQYENGTLTEISDPLFGDTTNALISKLCWGSDRLFAATYNDKTGTQIWEYVDSTWTCLINDGFGDKNNYNVVDMKYLNDFLVVSTENIDGGKIFYFNPTRIEELSEIIPKSPSSYLNYLLEFVKGKLFLIGRELKLFDVDGTTNVYLTKQDKYINEAFYWPNGAIGAKPIGIEGGRYRFFAGNGAYTMISEGTIDNPLENVSMSPRVSGTPEFKSQIPESIIFPSSLNYSIASTKIVTEPNAQPGAFTDKFSFNASETDQFLPFSPYTLPLVPTNPLKFRIFSGRDLPEGFQGLYWGRQEIFNAIHMALIPKGKHRGKVWMMSGYPIIAQVSSIHPTEPWSFQAWSIYDPSPDAGTPENPKFLNYMLPIGPSSVFIEPFNEPFRYGVSTDDITWPNLFCAGHAWTPSGDLFVAGGSKWGFEYSYQGFSWADDKCFIWNPETPSGSYYGWSGTDATGTVVSAFTNQGHYASAGSWTRFQDLARPRWYPTVMIYPKVERTSNHPHALVLGGATTLANFPQLPFDTYESYIISSIATSSNPGVGYEDEYDGPSDRETSSLYGTCPPDPLAPNFLWQDSFYYYPRTFILSGGEITFAGMTHISPYLPDYNADPEAWNRSFGGSGINSNNRFTEYCTSYRVPNVNGNPDILVRAGGSDTFSIASAVGCNTVFSSTDIIDGSNLNSVWSAGPSLPYDIVLHNSLLLPDATVMIFGGKTDLLDERYEARRMSDSIPFDRRYHPIILDDHHTWESFSFISTMSATIGKELEEYYQHEFEELEESQFGGEHGNHQSKIDLVYVKKEDIAESTAANTDGSFQYYVHPKIIDYKKQNPQWQLMDWTQLTSWRDYHSTTLLLPDGRVLIGGGENRHNSFNPAEPNPNSVFPGYDFEIFAPKYLRPTQNPQDTLLRPTGVGLSGSTYNSDPQVDCNELNYNGQYVVSCTSLRNGISIKKVVLMAPGCVTHHADITQRYYACSSVIESETQLRFNLPANEYMLAPGFYMLFVLTNQEVPSEALWVWLR